MAQRSGIATAGNWIVDRVKIIDHWPDQDTLAVVLAEDRGTGGGAYNSLVDLQHMGVPYPLRAIGCVGDDADGTWIRDDLTDHGIDHQHLVVCPDAPTSYTEVMSVADTGRRTFFHNYGANAELGPEHFPLDTLDCRVLHLAYLLLLKRLDTVGADGRSAGAAVLEAASRAGLVTSLDLVSEASPRVRPVVLPALPHVDSLVINELEAQALTGIECHGLDDLRRAAQALLDAGVRQQVIIHQTEGGYGRLASGGEYYQPSLRLPDGFIKGAVGAGDAFAAGVLHGLHESWDLPSTLRLAVATATACLRHATCTKGVGAMAENLALLEQHPFRAS